MMNSTPEWIARSVSRLRSADKARDTADDKSTAKAALDKAVTDGEAKPAKTDVPRTTHERLLSPTDRLFLMLDEQRIL